MIDLKHVGYSNLINFKLSVYLELVLALSINYSFDVFANNGILVTVVLQECHFIILVQNYVLLDHPGRY